MSDLTLLETLRKRHADATVREAEAVEMLIAVHQYIPPNLLNLSTGRPTAMLITEWLEKTYDLKLTYPSRNGAEEAS